MEREHLLRPAELAEYLNVSISTLYRAVRHHGLPTVRVTGDLRFRVTDVERWLDERRTA